jgi:hypothetical protein
MGVTLRISSDAKVGVKVGEFDRGGKTRVPTGWLEQHWNGSLLDSLDIVLKFASTLTFKGKQPVVSYVEDIYQTGVKLTKQAMAKVEEQIERLPNLEKWFVSIIGRQD